MNPTLLPLGLVWLLAARTAALDPASLRERLPRCSLLCLADGVTRHNCSLADVECQCDKIEPIIRTVAPCLVQAGCDLQNITATGRVVLDVCKTLPAGNETKPGGEGDVTTGTGSAAKREGVGWVLVAIAAAASVLL
ncbi:hypothetical protein E5D57_008374 [Metarhizium anisopliae]|nr:hypothetical protein E5D57_008374 [Metarhizium anisopliae]